ncbi:hypothetical protein [Eubacterium barkeri]|uniref:Uncharacterized protein n=1 Tax=Eubacterium barkeri TaxID=1528 RepID=A0A1H3BGT3_EUBBA|nr:hypothetical protein [Eubacterium barkeri]SDX41143.1 hypothetical protein SAMN04488579_10275 [Eubacterium barkeri]
MSSNSKLIEHVVEITAASISDSKPPIGKDYGKNVSDFMQVIYDKLKELNTECTP